MLTFKPTQEDLELRERNESRMHAARQALDKQYLLHPANAVKKKPASPYP